MAQQTVLNIEGINNSSNELKTLSADVAELCKTMYDEIKALKETKEFKTMNASELYFQTIDNLNGVIPKYTDDVLKFSEFLSNYVLTNYEETDQEAKAEIENDLEESLEQLENVNELGNGVNLDKISASAQGALNGDWVKVKRDVFQDGELEFKMRDDGTIQIMKNGTTLGFTTQDGSTNGSVSTQTEASVTPAASAEQTTGTNPVTEASTAASIGIATATTPITSTQNSPSGVNSYTSLGTPPVDSSFKAYMGYQTLTSKNSKQYAMQHSENCYTDESGFRRYSEDGNDYYMVALGSHYTGGEVGKKYRITLDNGQQFYAIAGDQKADIHTDSTHMYRDTGTTTNVVEFIVDTAKIPSNCKKMGSMSSANGGQFEGNVVDIELMNT